MNNVNIYASLLVLLSTVIIGLNIYSILGLEKLQVVKDTKFNIVLGLLILQIVTTLMAAVIPFVVAYKTGYSGASNYFLLSLVSMMGTSTILNGAIYALFKNVKVNVADDAYKMFDSMLFFSTIGYVVVGAALVGWWIYVRGENAKARVYGSPTYQKGVAVKKLAKEQEQKEAERKKREDALAIQQHLQQRLLKQQQEAAQKVEEEYKKVKSEGEKLGTPVRVGSVNIRPERRKGTPVASIHGVFPDEKRATFKLPQI